MKVPCCVCRCGFCWEMVKQELLTFCWPVIYCPPGRREKGLQRDGHSTRDGQFAGRVPTSTYGWKWVRVEFYLLSLCLLIRTPHPSPLGHVVLWKDEESIYFLLRLVLKCLFCVWMSRAETGLLRVWKGTWRPFAEGDAGAHCLLLEELVTAYRGASQGLHVFALRSILYLSYSYKLEQMVLSLNHRELLQ